MSDKKVDEDWKRRAAEEKQQDTKGAAESPIGPEEFPEADLKSFLSGIATQVLLSLGDMENPITGAREQNLPQAKYSIDLLQIVKDKTRGNLTDDEEKYLDAILYDLRMRYVEACRPSL